MYGSVFGFEDVMPAMWLKPVDAMTNLPFIGQLNTVFIVAIAFGMGLNLLVMLFQIINAAKAHDLEDMLFSHNGIAGLVFYAFIVMTIVLYMTGHKTPGNILMVIFLGIPILLFLFKEHREHSGNGNNARQIHFLLQIQDATHDKEQCPLSEISEHGSEYQCICECHKHSRIHLIGRRKSVHLNKHLKRFEEFRILELGCWLSKEFFFILLDHCHNSVIVFNLFQELLHIRFTHPSTDHVMTIFVFFILDDC